MSYPEQLVSQLDSLVRACAAESLEPEQERALLARMAELARQGEVTVLAGPTRPTCNGTPVEGAAIAAGGLVSRMRERGLERLFMARDAEPGELLLLARVLAGAPTGAAEGAELTLRTVRVSPPAEGRGGALHTTPTPTPAWVASTLHGPDPFEPALREPTPAAGVRVALPGEIVGVAEQRATSPAMRRVTPMINTPILLRAVVEQELRDQPIEALQASLTAVGGLPPGRRVLELGPILEELAHRAELALRGNQPSVVRDVILSILRAEEEEGHDEARLVFRMVRRRLLTLPYLRVLARLLPRSPADRAGLTHALGRAGEEGAEAVIEELATAESPSDRKAYFSTLVRMQTGEASLIHMLADRRWYVVRNAVELLGEIRAIAAEDGLLAALEHHDERVRRSALGALGRLGTTRALHAVQEALGAPETGLRAHAAAVLAGSDWPYTAAALGRRLREEEDGEVQLAIVAALGRAGAGSERAVAILEELAGPPRLAILSRRRAALRAAAADALAAARAGRRARGGADRASGR